MGRLSANFLKQHGFAPNDTLIQSGTQNGVSLKYCAPLFKTIHTIEIDDHYYNWSRERLARFPHVHCHHGSSPDVLRKVIDPRRKTIIWCDAHFVASDENLPAQVKNQCPVLEELCAIFSFRWKAKLTVLL